MSLLQRDRDIGNESQLIRISKKQLQNMRVISKIVHYMALLQRRRDIGSESQMIRTSKKQPRNMRFISKIMH